MRYHHNDNATSPDLAVEDDESVVEQTVLLATWRAHQQNPIPFEKGCAGYDDLMCAHYLRFEAMLTLLAPQLVFDLDGAIWGPHHRAVLRLRDYLELDHTALALTELAPDLIYAISTAPYVTQPSGKRSLCLDTLALKQKWYRQVRMAN